MSELFNALFTRTCSHRFAWPRRTSGGILYQVCLICGDCFRYDWTTMRRGERIDVAPETAITPRTTWKPRSRRIRWEKPLVYRESDSSEWINGTVENISESGVSFIGEQLVTAGVELEMIFVMPYEITGQPNSRVLCRADVARVVPGGSGKFALAVVMSGYSFLPDE